MKYVRFVIFNLVFLLACSLPAMAGETTTVIPPHEDIRMNVADLRVLLNSYTAFAEEHIKGVLRCLKILSVTNEARSGEWNAMKGLLEVFDKSGINAATVLFVRPDGSYYTVEKGLTDQNLRDRTYFHVLMAGGDVVGDLVISKSTGKRTFVIAVPVKRNGKVIGAIEVTLLVDAMSRMLEERAGLPENMIFYAINEKGQVAIHRKSNLLFAFPSDMGSETLTGAVRKMLATREGVVNYDFQGKKTVVFKRSRLTGWTFALGVVTTAQQGNPPVSR
jgi:hypothetical protein